MEIRNRRSTYDLLGSDEEEGTKTSNNNDEGDYDYETFGANDDDYDYNLGDYPEYVHYGHDYKKHFGPNLTEEQKAKKEDPNFILFCKQLLLKSVEEDDSFYKFMGDLFQDSKLFIVGKHLKDCKINTLAEDHDTSLGDYFGFNVIRAIINLKPQFEVDSYPISNFTVKNESKVSFAADIWRNPDKKQAISFGSFNAGIYYNRSSRPPFSLGTKGEAQLKASFAAVGTCWV